MSNKELDKFIEKIFLKYKMNKIRLESTFYIEKMQEEVKQMQDFVYVIDSLLNLLKKREKEFMLNVYINQIPRYEMPISESNYYYKKHKYNNKLYKYLEGYGKKWLQLQL